MADHITVNGSVHRDIKTPLTLTAMQIFVGGFIHFLELPSGDLMVVNEASRGGNGYYNKAASQIAGMPVHGDAILCSPEDIE